MNQLQLQQPILLNHPYKIIFTNENNSSSPITNIETKSPSYYRTAKKTDYVHIEIQFKPTKIYQIEYRNYGSVQIEVEIYNKDSQNNPIDNFIIVPKQTLLSITELSLAKLGDEKIQSVPVHTLGMMPDKEYSYMSIQLYNPFHTQYPRFLGLSYFMLFRKKEDLQKLDQNNNLNLILESKRKLDEERDNKLREIMGKKPGDPQEITLNKGKLLNDFFKNRTPNRQNKDNLVSSDIIDDYYGDTKLSHQNKLQSSNIINNKNETHKRSYETMIKDSESFPIFENEKLSTKKLKTSNDDEDFFNKAVNKQNNDNIDDTFNANKNKDKQKFKAYYYGGYLPNDKTMQNNNTTKLNEKQNNLRDDNNNKSSSKTKKESEDFDKQLQLAIEASKKSYEIETAHRRTYQAKNDEIYIIDENSKMTKINENSNDFANFYNSLLDDYNEALKDDLNNSIEISNNNNNNSELKEPELVDDDDVIMETKAENDDDNEEDNIINMDKIIQDMDYQIKNEENIIKNVLVEENRKMDNNYDKGIKKKYWNYVVNEFQLMMRLNEDDVTEQYLNQEKMERNKYIKREELVITPHANILKGVVFSLSGFENPERQNLRNMACDMGAKFVDDLYDGKITHLVTRYANTPKYKKAKTMGIFIVTKNYIIDTYNKKLRQNERQYAKNISSFLYQKSYHFIGTIWSNKALFL